MEWYYILGIIIVCIILLVILMSYICYRLTFYSKGDIKKNKTITLPDDEIFTTYKPQIMNDIEDVKKFEHTDLYIKSFDGLTLHASYYEYQKGAPVEIMFHGYKGSAIRDMSSGVKRAFKCKRNALLVDQRASGPSEGHIITFGIKERYDCISWINKAIEIFGSDVKIIIAGVSMGAATVLMASSMSIPKNVKGVIADCGYNKPSDIIKKVIKDMKVPVFLAYPFVKLGAKIFGHFNLEEASPYESVQKTNLPIIFIHGDKDKLVPHDMSQKLYDACKSKKKLVTIKDSPHGVSYLVDPDSYIEGIESFFINYKL